ncbi:ArsR/SmtB family transcription factor [Vannielia litorea]|uniref:Transcriptional regulator, ArsR family n=1 Tax=Vannielia litorea TaxID=1217970 RepID=A0A1N6IEL0_9RHOB|nr:winged helix-turn-helix domain-containing protein [Vannielia litorea]SIO30467.1 transcriptional regulator, ArsR family [Vannielia litorea]
MKEGPDITRIAALIGDPARANMLTALLSGKALTASELAGEAGITAPTASGHLARLEEAGLLWRRRQGRHHYFTLAGAEVAEALEALAGLAAARGHLRTRTGPRDDALREARVCYDHLAGQAGIRIFDSLAGRGALTVDREAITLTGAGAAHVEALGIDLAPLRAGRRPLCRACLDWSERRSHLAGSLGAAILTHSLAQGWATRAPGSRVVRFTPRGAAAFAQAFPL